MLQVLVFFAVLQGFCYVRGAGAGGGGEAGGAGGAVVAAPKIKLNDGHEMPALALGTWLGNNSSGRITPAPESNEVENAVKWAIEAGYRHVDTAPVYRTEPQVGAGIRASGIKREDIFVTTKLWNSEHARAAVVPALRASLAALGLARVDLYLVHWPVGQFDNGTYDTTDYLDTWRGMLEARALNLTRSVGLSNFSPAMVDRILQNGLEKPAALQVELNLNLQQPELLAYCKQHDIAVMGYTPFGSLFPSKATPGAPPPRLDEPRLLEMAHKYNKTVPQIALRYLHELGVVPLPKSTTRTRIEQNIDIFDFSLSPEDKQLLRGYDRGYRTIPQTKWRDHPYYPFEKDADVAKSTV